MKLSIAIGLVLLLCSCKDKPFTHLKGKTMGTYYDIQYKSGKDYSFEINSLLNEFILAASTYDSTSEISIFNRDGHLRFKSKYLPRLLTIAKRIHYETRGAFEPTLMPLIRAHGFSTSGRQALPKRSIDSLLRFVSLEYIQYDSIEMTASKPGVQLDLSAIGEGFAIDLISSFLNQNGVTDFKVEIGGEMKCKGRNPLNSQWIVGIEKPESTGELFNTTMLQDEAISTSGVARKFFIDDNGQRRSHIIDPKTGLSINNNLLSVSVKHTEATLADGLATSLMVMGLDSAKAFAMKYDYKILLLFNENGKVLSWSSPNFFNTQDKSITLR